MTRIHYTNASGESKELLVLANDDSVGRSVAEKLEQEGNAVWLVEFNAHATELV